MICPILSQASRDSDGNVLWEHHDCIENACTFWATEASECGLRASGLLAIRGGAPQADAGHAPGREEWRDALAHHETAQREMGLKLLEGVLALEEPVKATGQELSVRLEALNASLLTVTTALEGRLSSLEEQVAASRAPAEPTTQETPSWAVELDQGVSGLAERVASLSGQMGGSTRALESITGQVASLGEAQQRLTLAISDEIQRRGEEADRRAVEESRSLNVRGAGLYHRGALEAAEKLFRCALEKDAAFAEAHNNLGLVLSRLGKAKEAEAAFARALELKPSMAEAMNNLGFLYHEGLEFEKAADLFRKAAATGSDGAIAWLNLGNACHRLGRHSEAVDAWRKAVQSDPLNEAARRALAAFQQEAAGN